MPDKVYVVTYEEPYEWSAVLGVYTSEELAEEAIQNYFYSGYMYDLTEVSLNQSNWESKINA